MKAELRVFINIALLFLTEALLYMVLPEFTLVDFIFIGTVYSMTALLCEIMFEVIVNLAELDNKSEKHKITITSEDLIMLMKKMNNSSRESNEQLIDAFIRLDNLIHRW